MALFRRLGLNAFALYIGVSLASRASLRTPLASSPEEDAPRAELARGKRSVRFHVEDARQRGGGSPARVAPDTFEGQESRGSERSRSEAAARRFARRLLAKDFALQADWQEPPDIESDEGVASFAKAAADALLTDGRDLSQAYRAAGAIDMLRSRCPARCRCLRSVVLHQAWDAASCDGEMQAKFGASPDLSARYHETCEFRCTVLRAVSDQLKLWLYLLWVPRRWARTITELRPLESALADTVKEMEFSDMVADGIIECDDDLARDFADIVADELGPKMCVRATDAAWNFLEDEGCASSGEVRRDRPECSCFGRIHQQLVMEEIRHAYHDHCGATAREVDCVFRHWRRRDACDVLANAGTVPLERLFGHGHGDGVNEAVREHCPAAARPARE